jgi:hypothetical protein
MEEAIKFTLRGVSIEQFATVFVPTSESIQVDLSVPIRTNYDERALAVGAKIQYLENDKLFLVAEVSCHFIITDDSWDRLTDYGSHDAILPKSFVKNLATISIGTLRGALCAKTENTPYSKYFLPMFIMTEDQGEDILMSMK